MAGRDLFAEAEKNANAVMKIETRLAKASMTRVERRDPHKTYNKMSSTKIKKLTPNLDLDNYFTYLGFQRCSAKIL